MAKNKKIKRRAAILFILGLIVAIPSFVFTIQKVVEEEFVAGTFIAIVLTIVGIILVGYASRDLME